MKIYQYRDYQDYVAAQTEANQVKINNVYVSRHSIESVAKRTPLAKSILCHGTRNGAEQRYFREYFPEACIIGTEISPSASQFGMTVQWDFHDVNHDWMHSFDIVYSNSFDHAMDPARALATWRDQLSDNGTLFLEYSPHVQSRRWDPLEISTDDLQNLVETQGLTVKETYQSHNANETITTTIYVLETRS